MKPDQTAKRFLGTQRDEWAPFRPPLAFWSRNRRSIWQLVALALVRAGLVTAVFALVRWIMYGVEAGQSVPWYALVVITLLALVLIGLRAREREVAERISQRHINRIRRVVLKRLYRASVRDIGRYSVGALASRLGGDLTALRRWFSLGYARLISNAVLIVVSLLLIALIHPRAAMVVAGALAFSIMLSLALGARLQDHLQRTRRARIRLSAALLERLQAMPAVRATGQDRRELKYLDRLGNRLEKAVSATGMVLGALRGLSEASAILLMVAVFISWQWLAPGLSAADVAALFSLVLFLSTPVRELGRVQEYYRGARLSLEKIRQLMRVPRVVRGRSRQIGKLPRPGEVQLQGVSIAPAVRGFSARVSAGEKVALIGPNGSGKSTILSLLMGLIKADKGQVLLHGVDPLYLAPGVKARQLGAFGPDLGLLRTSVRRNIDYRLGDSTDNEILQMAEYCGLLSLLRRLPKGLDSLITDHCGNISSGEKARIALARALMGHPGILLLDEPESHLDSSGLKVVRHLLQTYPGTILVSTHHPELVGLCDTTWSMDTGRSEVINLNTIRSVNNQ